MEPRETLETAYQLLPPPLSALPAKYWTSISLWLHSYTVARTFQEFIEAYSEARDVEVPLDDEALLIGFLHDLGQKLQLRGRPSEEKLLEWVRDRLEALGFTRGEAEELSRYLYTNPAETLTDPLYDRAVWRLLWLADRLQGVDNPLAIEQLLAEAKEDLGEQLNVVLINVAIPQPFMRTLISRIVHRKLEKMAEDGALIMPVTTPYGLAAITDTPGVEVEIEWDEVRRGFKGDGILPEKVEENLEWNMKCCKDKNCKKRCSAKNKNRPAECKEHNMSPDSCNKAVYLGKKVSTYEFTLIYYGFRDRIRKQVILPKKNEYMFQNIRIKGVEYGSYGKEGICPVCGVSTPVGVMADYLKFFNNNIVTEQWTRKVFPGNVNTQIMRNPNRYLVDPLCLGEAILRGSDMSPVLVSLTLRAVVPLPVLEEVGRLTYALSFKLGLGVPRHSVVTELVYSGDGFGDVLGEVAEKASGADVPNFFYDAFTSTVIIPYRQHMQRHQDEWLRDIITAGVLAAWGLYPLTVSEAVPSAPSEALLSYYKGRRLLYDYQPKDRRVGGYTPYVAMAMASLSELSLRASGESLPALLEILDYPPDYAPLLLQYGSPLLYSRVESLRARLGVGG